MKDARFLNDDAGFLKHREIPGLDMEREALYCFKFTFSLKGTTK